MVKRKMFSRTHGEYDAYNLQSQGCDNPQYHNTNHDSVTWGLIFVICAVNENIRVYGGARVYGRVYGYTLGLVNS